MHCSCVPVSFVIWNAANTASNWIFNLLRVMRVVYWNSDAPIRASPSSMESSCCFQLCKISLLSRSDVRSLHWNKSKEDRAFLKRSKVCYFEVRKPWSKNRTLWRSHLPWSGRCSQLPASAVIVPKNGDFSSSLSYTAMRCLVFRQLFLSPLFPSNLLVYQSCCQLSLYILSVLFERLPCRTRTHRPMATSP